MDSLPPLHSLDDNISMQKKHFYSENANWVVPGVVLAGGSPARANDIDAYVKDLSENANVTTYVCLQAEVVPQSEDAEDLGGIQIGNEVDQMPSYAEAVSQANPASEPKFVYYGMKDDEIAPSDDSLRALIENISKRIEDGEVLYIHCKGGSGRTGIVVACLLGVLYPDLSADEVLKRTQKYFELRSRGVGKWVNPKRMSPATDQQKDQVQEFIAFAAENVAAAENTASDGCTPSSCTIM
jgi:hypothetical protein